MIFSGLNRSSSSLRNLRFSSSSSRRRTAVSHLVLTSLAIMLATILRTRIYSSSDIFSSYIRSIEMVPITLVPIETGTQIKLSSCFATFCRLTRFKNSGSAKILGTIIALPVCITIPVIPSPMRYLTLRLSLSAKL